MSQAFFHCRFSLDLIIWKSCLTKFFCKKKFPLDFSKEVCYTRAVGAWLSLVERFLGVEEVVGSNPVAPTSLDISSLQGLSECYLDSSIFLP